MSDEKRPHCDLRLRILLTAILSLLPCQLAVTDDVDGQESAFDTAQVQVYTTVSSEFRETFRTAWQTIPPAVWQQLDREGWQICLAQFVVEAVPELSGYHPRGWPPGTTWDNADAVHFSARRLLAFAEKRRNSKGQVVAAHRIPQVVRHEVGHALDTVLNESGGLYSATPDFYAAYHRDLKRMSADDRRALAYFSQSGAPGRQETFAEAFAILLGGGSDLENGDRFTAAFPTVMKLVEYQIERFR